MNGSTEGSWVYFVGTCSALSLSNGKVSYDRDPLGGRYPVNTKASFSCNGGYNRDGDESRTCQSSGNWNQNTPTCNEGNGFHDLIDSSEK